MFPCSLKPLGSPHLYMFVPQKIWNSYNFHHYTNGTFIFNTDTQLWYFYSCNPVIPRSNKNINSASQFQYIFKQTVDTNKSDTVLIQEVSLY